jgi:hypothetical protein
MRNTDRLSRSTAALDERQVALERSGEASGVIQHVVDTGRATLVTDDGVAVAAVLDAATYHAILVEQLRRDLLAAAAEADAGHLVEHKEVLQELRDRFRGRVPHSLLKAFDAE